MLEIIGRNEPLFSSDILKLGNKLSNRTRKSSFLIIGGAGTIGQATTQEIFKRDPKVLHVVDISENNLVELVRNVRSTAGYGSVFTIYLLSYSEGGEYIKSVIPRHLTDRVLVRYEAPHNETIKLQKSADILALIVMNNGLDFSYSTAKIFEYMNAGVKIVSNAAKGSEIDNILFETKSGCLIGDFVVSDGITDRNNRNILQ